MHSANGRGTWPYAAPVFAHNVSFVLTLPCKQECPTGMLPSLIDRSLSGRWVESSVSVERFQNLRDPFEHRDRSMAQDARQRQYTPAVHRFSFDGFSSQEMAEFAESGPGRDHNPTVSPH
jgi:hypothetical protein